MLSVSDKDIPSYINQELSFMQSKRSDFEKRWERNNRRYNTFLIQDSNGARGLPTAWNLCQNFVDEIAKIYNGNVKYLPKIDGAVIDSIRFQQLTKIYAQTNMEIGVQDERKLVLLDAVRYGTGILYEGFEDDGDIKTFSGLISERVDPRDFFIDYSAQKWYDSQDKIGAQKCIRRRWFKKSSFEKDFKGNKDFNQKAVNDALESGATATVQRERISIQEDGVSEIDTKDVIQVLEYWTRDELIMVAGGDLTVGSFTIFRGKNIYGMLPFVVYSTFRDGEALYPPALLEILAGLLGEEEVLNKLWQQSAIFNSAPKIFATEKTGLISGEMLRPGVQVVEDVDNINQAIQQFVPIDQTNSLQTRNVKVEDKITQVSAVDQRSLESRPEILATDIKNKIATEQKRLRGIVDTMVKSAETYRALLRGRNILEFILSDSRDIQLNNTAETVEGELTEREGATTTVAVSPDEWKSFEFSTMVLSEDEENFNKQERINSANKLLEILGGILGNQFVPEEQKAEIAERIDFVQLTEEIITNIEGIDTDKIFKKKESKSIIKDEIERVMQGEEVQTAIKDNKMKTQAQKSTIDNISKTEKDVGSQKKLLKHLFNLNDKNPKETLEKGEQVLDAQAG